MKKSFKKNKILRVNICFLVVFALLISSVSVAFASSVSSTTQYKTVYSIDYEFDNTATNFGDGVNAHVYILSDSGTVPTGYMGGNAKLYTRDGSLSRSSGMTYNSTPMVATAVYTPDTPFTAISYYAQSTVEFYNGNGYTSSSVDRTPVLQGAKSLNGPINIKAYKTNTLGETYGSELYEMVAGVKPDLIAAVGDNGISGYVRNTDINPIHKTIEEALAYNNVTEIPLYAKDGTTIIGTFSIGHDVEEI